MEISNEIKAKVFAPYLGQPISVGNSNDVGSLLGIKANRSVYTGVNSVGVDCWYKLSSCKLLLKPLSQISDDDKAELAKELGESVGPGYEQDLVYWGNFWVNKFLENEYMEVNKTVLIIQFLQSRGYDLPNYLLGGKTLNEAGLAIYE